jgi:AcrR family transcriptional regulator
MTNPVTGQASPPIRGRILDAAERLLERYGYRKMTVEELASEAGIGKGTVYLSFRSKEEVVLATVDRIVDAVCEEMDGIAASGLPAPERLSRMLLARVLVRFDRVARYRESLNDLLGAVRRGLLQRRQRHFECEAAILASAVRDGQRAGEFASGDPRRVARALLLATNSFLPYSLSPAELGDRRRLQADAQDVVRLLVGALTVPHATSGQQTAPVGTATRRRGAV